MRSHGLLLTLAGALAAFGGCQPTGNVPGGVVSPAPSASTGPARPVDEDPAVRELHLSLDELKKELAEKGDVSRARAPDSKGGNENPSDSLITGKVKSLLRADPEVPAMSLEVEAHNGRVTLTGRVGSIEQLQHALLAALKVPQVASVTSKILVEPDDGNGPTKGDGQAAPPR